MTTDTPPGVDAVASAPAPGGLMASPIVGAATALGLAAAVGAGFLVGPVLLILGLTAAGLLIGTLWRPELATVAFFFVLWGNFLAVATQFHGAPSVVAGAFVLILCVPLLHRVVVRREPIVVTPALPLILGYLVAMLLAAATASHVTAAIRPISEFLVEGLLLYLLVTNVVTTANVLRRAIWAIVLAGALMGTLSIVQELSHGYGNNFGGLAQVTEQGFKVGEDQNGKVLRPRLAGPIGEQNRYAQILLVAAPLAVFRGLHERTRRLRRAAAVCGVPILAGILLTFSRGAMVAFLVLFLLMVLRGHIRLRHAIAGFCLLGVAVFVVEPDYAVRISSLARVGGLSAEAPGQDVDGAVLGRATSNLAAWDTFLDHPLTGVGPGRYFKEYSQQAGNELNLRHFDKNRRAHNMYLETAADLGILGIGALLGAVGVTAFQLASLQRHWRSRDPELAALASSLLFSLAAYMSTAIFLHLAYQRYFWLVLGLANAAIWVLSVERGRAQAVAVDRALSR